MNYTWENLLEAEKEALLRSLESARRLRERSPNPALWDDRITQKEGRLAEVRKELGEPAASAAAAPCAAN